MAARIKSPQSTSGKTQSPPVLDPGIDEAGYRRLVDLSPMPTLVHVAGTIVYANQATAKVIGAKDPHELIGKNVMQFVHPDSVELVKERVAAIYEKGLAHTDAVEEKLVRLDGEIIYVELVSLLFHFEGRLAIQLVARDITKEKKAQEALLYAKAEAEAERQRLHDLFMQAPASIAMVRGPEHTFEFANPLYMDLIGSNRKVLGRKVKDALPEVVEQGFIKLLDDVYQTGKPYIGRETEITFVNTEGDQETKYLNFVYQPSRDADGRVDGILVHAIDVTDQVLARREIEYTNTLLTTITNNASLGLFMMDENQHCTFMNAAAEKITGYTFREVRGKALHDFIHHTKPNGSPYPLKECPIDRALPQNNRQQGEEIFVHKDGSFYPVRFTASPIIKEGKPVGTVIEAQDLTEERKAQAALVESEERFRQLADSMPQMVWTATPDGEIDYRNKQWYAYTGFSTEKNLKAWALVLHPDDRSRSLNAWKEAIRTGGPYEIEYRLRDSKNPNKYRWFLARATLVRDADGTPLKWYGTSTDIDDVRRTTQRKKELEELAAALTEQRSQLVALNRAKDEFISLASHQLRTPATGVKQYIGMVLEGYAGELKDEQRAFLQRAYESNEREITIINDLLKVAQVDAGKVNLAREKVDLTALIRNVINEQSSRFAERAQTITFKPSRTPISLTADTSRLRMVLDNMIDNASKYTPPGKSIEVRLAKIHSTIRISVSDEGVGIEEKDIEKIFRKFSRIDNPLSVHVGGSGLGLYWVKKIIDLHHGDISVKSTPGKGSTFTISLPSQ